ncbi:MAG: aminotransferase class IV family protein [Planctomycetia bacterium]|nr:aminotransferase class IV family protein [Planctomycetia bacterium]
MTSPSLVWTSRGWSNDAAPWIPVGDLAAHHGFGFFETLRAYRGRVFRPDDHFARMARSARAFRVKLPLDAGGFRRAAADLLQKHGNPDARVRLTVTAGPPPLAAIQVLPLAPPSDAAYRRGVSVWLAPWIRCTRSALAGHKSLNYFENYWARTEGERRGHFEALFLNERGELSEGTRANVFWADRGRVFTPALSTGILSGVTRTALLEILRARRVPVEECACGPGALFEAREAFLASTIVEVLPVVSVGRRRIGNGRPGPLAALLRREFRRKVGRELAGAGR